jgi:hypothetical protein
MLRYLFSTAVAILMFFTITHAQDFIPQKSPSRSTFTEQSHTSDVFTLGLGFGQDYGGFGGNITVYPQKNIGLFVGFGDALAALRSPDAQNYIDQLNSNGGSFSSSLIPITFSIGYKFILI